MTSKKKSKSSSNKKKDESETTKTKKSEIVKKRIEHATNVINFLNEKKIPKEEQLKVISRAYSILKKK